MLQTRRFQLEFRCKDGALVRFYETEFDRQLVAPFETNGLVITKVDLLALYEIWARSMAETHAHYDYDIVDGERRPIIKRGKPRLLYPRLVVHDAVAA